MTWTYGGDPAASAKDAVRFAVGDTDAADPLVTDEEITYALGLGGGVTAAAARVADALWAKFARLCDLADGTLRISYGQRAEYYQTLADTLRREARTTIGAAPVSVPDCQAPPRPIFRVGQFDAPPTDHHHSC